MNINTNLRALEIDEQEVHKLLVGFGEGEFMDIPNQNVVLESLSAFLPHIKQDQSTIQYQMMVAGTELTTRSKPLGKKKVSDAELSRFKQAIINFQRKAAGTEATPKAKKVIENFRLPNPETHSEFYRLYGPPWDRKLLVIWGCEKEPGSSLPPLKAIEILERQKKPVWKTWLERAALLALFLLLMGGVAAILYSVFQPGHVPPMIVRHPQPRNAPTHVDAPFSVSASGSAPLAYQWRFNGADISHATQKTYVRYDVKAADAGNYSVAVSNLFGSVTSSNALLTVVPSTITTANITATNITASNITGLPFATNQFLSVDPVSALLPTNLAAWARAAGMIDFHGQKQVQTVPGQTNYYDGFSKNGKYRIEWTPDDSRLNIEARIVLLSNATNKLPHANLQLIPRQVDVGDAIRADERASFSGDPLRKIVKYEINWDGQFRVLDKSNQAHVFNQTNTYPILLRVTDDAGRTDTDTEMAYVGTTPPTRQPPIARLKLLGKDQAKLSGTVADNGSVDPDGKIVSWTLNWGDNTPDQQFDQAPTNQSHQFPAPSLYYVSLNCVDDQQTPSHQPSIVEVDLRGNHPSPVPPKIATNNPLINLTVAVTGQKDLAVSFKSGVDAFGFPVTLKVDYGDGSAPDSFELGSGGSSEKRHEDRQFDHTYPQDGKFKITATATDTQNESTTRTLLVPAGKHREYEIVQSQFQLVSNTNAVEVLLMVKDKADPNAPNPDVKNWIVNDAVVDRAEDDYTPSPFRFGTTNFVSAIIKSGLGEITEIRAEVRVGETVEMNGMKVIPLPSRPVK